MTVAPTLVPTRAAAERSGATYRQIDYWTRAGVIRPTVPADGSGSLRGWSDEDVVVLTALARTANALSHAGGGGPSMEVLRQVETVVRCMAEITPNLAAVDAMPITVHLDAGVTLTLEAGSTS